MRLTPEQTNELRALIGRWLKKKRLIKKNERATINMAISIERLDSAPVLSTTITRPVATLDWDELFPRVRPGTLTHRFLLLFVGKENVAICAAEMEEELWRRRGDIVAAINRRFSLGNYGESAKYWKFKGNHRGCTTLVPEPHIIRSRSKSK